MIISDIPAYQQTSGESPAFPPKRIVSVVPSQTELLCALGLSDSLVGVTKFCVHPTHIRKSTRVIGGTKHLRIHDILALQPDLVLANREENTREQILELAETLPVWVSDIQTVSDALNMILDVGALTGTEAAARSLNTLISEAFAQLSPTPRTPKRVLYLIWREPWMSVGADTFIHDVLQKAAWQNACAHLQRYPALSDDDIRQLDPDYVFLSSEPYPFKARHLAEIQALLPKANIQLVDGEYFSWYGSRMLPAVDYLKELSKLLL